MFIWATLEWHVNRLAAGDRRATQKTVRSKVVAYKSEFGDKGGTDDTKGKCLMAQGQCVEGKVGVSAVKYPIGRCVLFCGSKSHEGTATPHLW